MRGACMCHVRARACVCRTCLVCVYITHSHTHTYTHTYTNTYAHRCACIHTNMHTHRRGSYASLQSHGAKRSARKGSQKSYKPLVVSSSARQGQGNEAKARVTGGNGAGGGTKGEFAMPYHLTAVRTARNHKGIMDQNSIVRFNVEDVRLGLTASR